MTVRLVSRNGGDELPVTLVELLDWLKRGDTDEDDDLIESCLLAAIDWAERFSGLVMIDSTYDLFVDEFPASGPIPLMRGPILELQSFTYRDSGSAQTTLAASGYGLNTADYSLYLPATQTWPSTDGAANALRIRYRAGFIEMTGSPSPDGDIPETIKAAIKLYAASLYGNRDNELDTLNASRVPWGAEMLLKGYIGSMTVSPKWIVAATGESLTEEVAQQCQGQEVIAVNDAYRRMPYARALYAADAAWWTLHNGCPGFAGEKWITVNDHCMGINRPVAEKYGLRMIWSVRREEGFSFRPGRIHIGANSGFQAVNLALLWGGQTVVLVGFDMRGSHFFGEHPPMARRSIGHGKGFMRWIRNFERAAEMLPPGIRIINATPGSALTCFPAMPLEEALRA